MHKLSTMLAPVLAPVPLLLLTSVLTGLSFVAAPYPFELVLQHLPTTVILLSLGISLRFFRLSSDSFFFIILFLWIHILGARWIYSFVPYDQWCETLFGFSLSERFGWERNHYDRFVHFASGILLVPPSSEALQRLAGMETRWAGVMAVSAVMSMGAIYEVAEWLLAVFLSPQHAESYNGQQGDVWDPQKDLAMAFIGSVISAALVFRRNYR